MLPICGPLASRVHGPHEVVLEDPKQKSSYKRLVQYLLLEGDVKFALPKPTCSFTTPLVSELVFELDSRCADKSLVAFVQQQPLNHFREKAIELLGASAVESAQFYGFRVNRNPPGGDGASQLQCIVKVPTTLRKKLISASGAVSQIFVRDFLDRSAQPDDTTVLPRFWPVSPIVVCTKSLPLPGFAGIQVTKRGLAVRAWITNLAEARKTFMTEDERICEANLAAVPKVLYNAAGWPPGVRPASLVDCVLKATKQAPIPTRAFREGCTVGRSASRVLRRLRSLPFRLMARSMKSCFRPLQVLSQKASPRVMPARPSRRKSQSPSPPRARSSRLSPQHPHPIRPVSMHLNASSMCLRRNKINLRSNSTNVTMRLRTAFACFCILPAPAQETPPGRHHPVSTARCREGAGHAPVVLFRGLFSFVFGGAVFRSFLFRGSCRVSSPQWGSPPPYTLPASHSHFCYLMLSPGGGTLILSEVAFRACVYVAAAAYCHALDICTILAHCVASCVPANLRLDFVDFVDFVPRL